MNPPIAMIIGPPRSGTSILGRALDQHPRISTWIEPYYIWDHFFRTAPDDELTAVDATDKVRKWIRSTLLKIFCNIWGWNNRMGS